MREIKFRAFTFKDKVMHNVTGTYESVAYLEWHGPGVGKGTHYINPDFNKWDGEPRKVDSVMLQYTGLNDKNGVEIYEGDVIEFEDGVIDHVIWNNEFQFHTENNYDNSQCNFNEAEAQVIGNIHQNPELIK